MANFLGHPVHDTTAKPQLWFIVIITTEFLKSLWHKKTLGAIHYNLSL